MSDDRNRRGEDADRVGHAARDHEHDRRQASRRQPEALLEQRVRGDDLALVVPRQQQEGDADAADDVAGDHLEEAEVARVREAREC